MRLEADCGVGSLIIVGLRTNPGVQRAAESSQIYHALLTTWRSKVLA
jgi:hypothetical protein